MKTLESLDLLPRLITAGATISQHAGCEKPDKKIYELACEAASVEVGEGVLMVGDELAASVKHSHLQSREIIRAHALSHGASKIVTTEEPSQLESKLVLYGDRGTGQKVQRGKAKNQKC